MAEGVGAAIYLKFGIEKFRFECNVEGFNSELFDLYDRNEEDDEYYYIYTIKGDFFLQNYQDFLVEFYDIINESTDALLIDKEAKKDMISFGDTYRREALPYIADRYDISTIVGSTPRPIPWIFYEERYGDAYFETYKTFKHFSRVLIKAMKNPLAKAVHFGELN